LDQEHREADETAPEPAASGSGRALELWQEKLAFFEEEYAQTADPELKISLRFRMREARREISRLRVKGRIDSALAPARRLAQAAWAKRWPVACLVVVLFVSTVLVAAHWLVEPPGAPVAVHVQGDQGQPLAGLSVTATPMGGALVEAVMAQPAGNYRFESLPVGEAEICARGAGYQDHCEKVKVAPGMPGILLSLAAQ
jgi:hypothetical protein